MATPVGGITGTGTGRSTGIGSSSASGGTTGTATGIGAFGGAVNISGLPKSETTRPQGLPQVATASAGSLQQSLPSLTKPLH
jgi:hypothetical protein